MGGTDVPAESHPGLLRGHTAPEAGSNRRWLAVTNLSSSKSRLCHELPLKACRTDGLQHPIGSR